MQLLLTFAGTDRKDASLAEYLAAHRVDGVLLVSVHADDPLPDLLEQLEIPAVHQRPPLGRTRPLPSVDSDNTGGARAAVEHLLGPRPPHHRHDHRPPRRLRRPVPPRRLPRRPRRRRAAPRTSS